MDAAQAMASPARQVQSMPHQRLDRDPSRLTTFPMPGYQPSGFQPSGFQQQGREPASVSGGELASSPFKVRGPPMSTGSQQYWMPDHLCKVCYDCGVSFSIFRRRHHCRLCGQIFCFDCSSEFIDGKPHGFSGFIRICKFCSRYVRGNGLRKSSDIGSLDLHHQQSVQGVAPVANGVQERRASEVDAASPLLFELYTPPADEEETSASAVDDDMVIPSLPDVVRLDSFPSLPRLYTIQSSESIDGEEPIGEDGSKLQTFQARPPTARKRRSSAELLGAIESRKHLDRMASVAPDDDNEETAEITESVTEPKPALKSIMSFRIKSDLHTKREINLDKHMQAAHGQIRSEIRKNVDTAAEKLSITDEQGRKKLASTLEDIAFVVAGHLLFSMQFRSTNGFNYANLVKVKSIAMAETVHKNVQEENYQFKWLAGTICRKQLSHKQMARQIANPRILLFACGISYDRSSGTGKFSSLDTLLEQEKSYMRILVDKITALEPDVIFVERTVSRYAQELLQERRVSIVLNVKLEMLERIGRHIGAELLTSVDHVDKVDPEEVVGTCRSFQAKTVPTVPEESPAGDRAIKPAGATGPHGGSRLRTETFIYLDGCDPLNGCTVLITGSSKPKLRVLKTLTRDVLWMTYRSLLEAHVLSDLNLERMTISEDAANKREPDTTVWCTTCTLRVREAANATQRYFQCTGSKHFGIVTYAAEDISLGNLLVQETSSLGSKCKNPKCNYLMADHAHTFSTRNGTVTISFEELPDKSKLPISLSLIQNDKSPLADQVTAGPTSLIEKNVLSLFKSEASSSDSDMNGGSADKEAIPTVVFWRWCHECNGVVTPFIPLEKYVYKYSFACFLDMIFAETQTKSKTDLESSMCQHDSLESHVLFFNVGDKVARFEYSKRLPLSFLDGNDWMKRSFGPSGGVAEGDRLVVEDAVSKRVLDLRQLLDSLFEEFSRKLQGIKQAVDAFEQCDESVHAHIILEVMCLKKVIECDQKCFREKVDKLALSSENKLADCDTAHRSLYLMACRWIDHMMKLRKLIKKSFSKQGATAAASPFSLPVFSFNTPTALSPVASPRHLTSSSITPSSVSRDSVEFASEAKERYKRRYPSTHEIMSLNGMDASPESSLIMSSSSMMSANESARKSSISSNPAESISSKSGDAKEPQSSWKTALWDLYRVLGRTTPGSDFNVDLPDALLAGHPSLPFRSSEHVILVNNSEPVTCVAYALASSSYEEQLDSWKVMVHAEAAASLASDPLFQSNVAPVSTNWSRAALTTMLNVPFKHSVSEMPIHLSLLSGSSSGTSPWEFSTIAYYPLQFEVLRQLFYGSLQQYLFCISHVNNWNASGGKSGASFYRTLDDRFVIKHITFTELQSFLDVLPAYFKHMAKIYFDGEESVLSKTVGIYQTTITRKDTGQKIVHYILVMENAFYHAKIKQTYDLKGSSRNRYIKPSADGNGEESKRVLLDGNLIEYTQGHPIGVLAEDHEFMIKAIKNDTAFLYSINVVDYSLVLGLGEEQDEGKDSLTQMTVGIIDYLRQFDLIKRVESVSKSVGMIAGQSSPTIIEPGMYGKRFREAVGRYFMPVTPVSSNVNPKQAEEGKLTQ